MNRTPTRAANTRRNRPRQIRDARHRHRPKPARATRARVIYVGLILIGFFAVVLAWLFSEHWREPLVLYVAIMGYLINASTWKIYKGRHIPNWQQALARIPLHFVGYGTKQGKPLEAAHHHQSTRNALVVSILVSVIVIAGLFLLLIPLTSD